MADTAAHLVDRVLPEVPVRQWVLSLPIPLRYRIAYDRELCSEVLGAFLRTVFSSLRRRAKEHFGVADSQSGSVSTLQRFGGSINLNLHIHAIILDGVYADPEATGTPTFHTLPPPDDSEIARVTAAVAKRIVRLLTRRGLLPDDGQPTEDPLASDEPLLAACASASLRGRIATGPRAGRRVMRLGDRIDVEDVESVPGKRCASVQGFSLHADVAIAAHDRRRLERLARYIARGPVATQRLSKLDDGRIAYQLRHPWRDGTTHVAFTELELVEKLAVLVPAPRGHCIRYHGVLAPGAKWRASVVRDRAECKEEPTPSTRLSVEEAADQRTGGHGLVPLRGRYCSWSDLMVRVFELDVLECPRCQGRCEVLAVITEQKVIQAFLACLGLATRAPPVSPARPAPEPEFAF
jgi:hypothetical protein